MHDLKYANQILDSLKKAAGKKGKNVHAIINVYLSPFSHVAPQRLKDVFGLLSKENGFTNIVLKVGVAEFCLHCKHCGHAWKRSEPTFECPECGSADIELEKYEEFQIDSIKIE